MQVRIQELLGRHLWNLPQELPYLGDKRVVKFLQFEIPTIIKENIASFVRNNHQGVSS